MSTRINGDNIRVPGYVFLENPLIGAEKALATGPNGEIISTSVSVENLGLLNTATTLSEADSLVKRDADGKISDLNYAFVQTTFSQVVIPFGDPLATIIQAGKGSMVIPANTLRIGSIIKIRFNATVAANGTGDIRFRLFINNSAAYQFEDIPLTASGENYGTWFEGFIADSTTLTGLPFSGDIHSESVADVTPFDLTVDNTFDILAQNITDDEIQIIPRLVWMEIRHAPTT